MDQTIFSVPSLRGNSLGINGQAHDKEDAVIEDSFDGRNGLRKAKEP